MKAFVLIATVALVSCSDRPSREKFPGPPGRTTDLTRAQNTQAVMGGVDPDADAGVIDTAPKKSIKGIVRLAEGFETPSNEYVVFISARPVGGGPPLAVQRRRSVKFPFRFELTEQDAMMGGTNFEGVVDLIVRVDQMENGRSDPLSRLPGDLFGSQRVKVGSQEVTLIINGKI